MPTAHPRILSLIVLLAIAACSSKNSPDGAASAPGAPATSEAAAVSATPAGEPTAAEISNYKLDMDKMRKFAQASRNLEMLSAQDSVAIQAALEAMADGELPSQMLIAKLESNPIVMRELRKAGLSAKDYVWTSLAYLQAEAGMMAPNAEVAQGENRQNVEFVTANQAELVKLTAPQR